MAPRSANLGRERVARRVSPDRHQFYAASCTPGWCSPNGCTPACTWTLVPLALTDDECDELVRYGRERSFSSVAEDTAA